MNKEKTINGKAIKKVIYVNKMKGIKKKAIIIVLAGFLAAIAYFLRYAYNEYAVSRAYIILTYPEIAYSIHPDNSRFTYHEFLDDERIEEALEIMHNEGKYLHFTADDLKDHLYLYSQLDGSAIDNVSSQRSEGNDFSFVANEYKITFIQPHDTNNKDFSKRIYDADYSGDFLAALAEVNRMHIADDMGGINGFKTLTAPFDTSGYDYNELLLVYKQKIKTIISYLKYIQSKESDFLSEETNTSIKELEGYYDFLITNTIDSISNYVESSVVSKDEEQAINKLRVNIENNTLKLNRYADRSNINKYAMENYDHTFTENLIVVIESDNYGLYQARPKTAFDTVAAQKYESDENYADYDARLLQLNNELTGFALNNATPAEKSRMLAKSDALIGDFERKYRELSDFAVEIVEEYYKEVNKKYLDYYITGNGLISKELFIKEGVVFALGMTIMFVVMVLFKTLNDARKLRKRKRMIRKIKNSSESEDN